MLQPVHFFVARNKFLKVILKAELCFHCYVHFDCVPIYIRITSCLRFSYEPLIFFLDWHLLNVFLLFLVCIVRNLILNVLIPRVTRLIKVACVVDKKLGFTEHLFYNLIMLIKNTMKAYFYYSHTLL